MSTVGLVLSLVRQAGSGDSRIKPSSFMLFAENSRLDSSRAGEAEEAMSLIYVMSEPPSSMESVSG